MRRAKIILFLFISIFIINVNASSGPIKQDSIIECNGKYYGNHSNPLHWHMVEYKNNKWVSISKETEIPPCYIKEVNVKETVTLAKCGDGDTARFIINGEEKKVRFLAIDTPEVDKKEPFSQEAKEYTCKALTNAKEIVLEYDSNSDKEDKYGRVLAFILVDGKLLQKELIEQGYAKVAYIYGDYEYLSELRKIEEVAKSKKLGIWNEEQLGDVEEKQEVIEQQEENVELEEEEEDNPFEIVIKFVIELLKKLFDLLFN